MLNIRIKINRCSPLALLENLGILKPKYENLKITFKNDDVQIEPASTNKFSYYLLNFKPYRLKDNID